MNDEEFNDLVNRELRDKATDEEVQYLNNNVKRWYSALTRMSRKVEGQLTQRREAMFLLRKTRVLHTHEGDTELSDEEFAEKELAYHDRRMRTLNAYSSMQKKIIEVKAKINSADQYERAYTLLRTAVAIHKESFVDKDDAGYEDEALWKSLDEVDRLVAS